MDMQHVVKLYLILLTQFVDFLKCPNSQKVDITELGNKTTNMINTLVVLFAINIKYYILNVDMCLFICYDFIRC